MSKSAATKLPVIVQVVESFGGGVFQSVSQLCEGLKDKARFIIVHDIRAETPENFAASFPAGTQFIQLSMGRAISPKDLSRAMALRKVLLGLKPHLVHAHSSKAGALTRMALLGTGIRRFYSPRGYGFLMKNSAFHKRAVYWLAERFLGFLPGTTIACGYDELTSARKVCLSTVVIPNGIDPDSIAPDNRQRPAFKGTLQVVSSGRISPQKNFPLFCAIASHFVDKPVQFTWVGGGDIPEGTVIPANVTITGWLPHAKSLAQLNKGHVYLHMSGWEGLSRIVLEAMAHGFPLVLSNIPGNHELGTAGNGHLCTTETEAVSAIERFLNNPALITQMGTASRTHLTKSYNWNTNLHMWHNVYKLESEVIPNRKKSA
jgi:glycosyltransferase involved in cell wall biosynthesis